MVTPRNCLEDARTCLPAFGLEENCANPLPILGVSVTDICNISTPGKEAPKKLCQTGNYHPSNNLGLDGSIFWTPTYNNYMMYTLSPSSSQTPLAASFVYTLAGSNNICCTQIKHKACGCSAPVNVAAPGSRR
ncbi:UNVERIFIED_CONTAM: hypothetical protein K2H54_020641 [Gekko kuhli]